MNPRLTVDEIEFNDGTRVKCNATDIMLIVGTNNSGKSQCLKDIGALFSRSNPQVVVKRTSKKTEGTWEEMERVVAAFSRHIVQPPTTYRYEGSWGSEQVHQMRGYWDNPNNVMSGSSMCSILVGSMSTGERLTFANSVSRIDLVAEKPWHPIHAMEHDETFERFISAEFRRAFDLDLVVHRNAGSQVHLFVGERPLLCPGEHLTSRSYLQRVERLPQLMNQGDGMRSFASLIFASVMGDRTVLMIDEPECFLHPPQIRVLAQFLAKHATEKQLWIATHSGDFVRAVVDAAPARVRVVRVERDGDTNRVSVLVPDQVREMWADPLLRHSNLLDGLFHERVVLCEADSDCRFYQAIASANNIGRDAMFCHTGGKHRLKTAAKALRALKVPTKIIADFDLLREQNILRELVEAVGGSWEVIEKDWKILDQAVRNGMPQRSFSEFTDNVNRILGDEKTTLLSPKTRIAIEKEIEASKPAAKLKASGKHAVPHGQPAAACDSLLASLKALGIHVVPNGELESFYRNVGGHGPDWVNEVLSLKLDSDQSLADARQFVADVLR